MVPDSLIHNTYMPCIVFVLDALNFIEILLAWKRQINFFKAHTFFYCQVEYFRCHSFYRIRKYDKQYYLFEVIVYRVWIWSVDTNLVLLYVQYNIQTHRLNYYHFEIKYVHIYLHGKFCINLHPTNIFSFGIHTERRKMCSLFDPGIYKIP